MWFLSRLLLIIATLSVMLVVIAFFIMASPWSWVALVMCLLAKATHKGVGFLTSFGSARWATAEDLKRENMLGGKEGLIIGRVTESRSKAALPQAMLTLLNPAFGSEIVVRNFFDSLPFRRRKASGRLVRLPKAVHTAVFAPTGVGKGVSFVIPHLLTCPDACVVIDFKGDLASKTAEYREKVFGHECVILDPFKVVTQ